MSDSRLLLHFQSVTPIVMPPHHPLQYAWRSLGTDMNTNIVALRSMETLDSSAHPKTSSLALTVVVPIVVGIVLIIGVFLMPKGSFWKLASKLTPRTSNASARSWFRRCSAGKESPTTKPSQPTFVECHLEMLRAWRKPTKPLPLPLAKPNATHQLRRPTSTSFHV